MLITVRRLVNPGNFGHRQEESNCPSQQLLKMNQAYTNQRAVVAYFRALGESAKPWSGGPFAGPDALFAS